jgi:hypothetical protein
MSRSLKPFLYCLARRIICLPVPSLGEVVPCAGAPAQSGERPRPRAGGQPRPLSAGRNAPAAGSRPPRRSRYTPTY